MHLLRRYLFTVLLICTAINSTAISIVRGPYLQLQTTNSIVIRWRTDKSTEGIVFFGETFNKLDKRISAPGLHEDHVVQLAGLKSNAKYYYAIGHVKKGADLLLQPVVEERYFTTAPPIGETFPSRVWIIGDSGTANKDALRVKEAFLKMNKKRHVDAWLMLGDNAYENGTDNNYQKAVFETYSDVLQNTVLWPTLGNHDGRSASSSTQSGVYFDIFTLPTMAQTGGIMSGTEAYYSFDFANIHFICLDSYDSDRSSDGPMLTWVKHDMATTTQDWIVCYFHHPPYTKGSHDSDDAKDSAGLMTQMREQALPVLEAGGIDLVLSGHSHSYERSFLIDGHYGKSKTLTSAMILNKGNGRPDGTGAYSKPDQRPHPNKGAVYTVAGSSGKKSGGKLNHPAMYLSLNRLGSLVIDVNGKQMDVQFVDEKAKRRDYFTMMKE